MGSPLTSSVLDRFDRSTAAQVVIPVRLALPIWRYAQLWSTEPSCFLLDSALPGSKLGRHSFIGSRPAATLRAFAPPGSSSRVELEIDPSAIGSPPGRPEMFASDELDPLEVFETLHRSLSVSRADVPGSDRVPFIGGAIGYFGYEAARFFQPPRWPRRGSPSPLPDMLFAFVDEVLAFDHETDRAYLSVTRRADGSARAEMLAEQATMKLVDRLRRFEREARRPWLQSTPSTAPYRLTKSTGKPEYLRQVECARAHIIDGDAFEVCLTREDELSCPKIDPWALYAELRRINPAPFASFLRIPEGAIISASPERFLRLEASGRVESRPIKGTRPRGQSPEEDLRLRSELAASEKDRAENLMIVDLVRNDLGRVCQIGSIDVPELAIVEDYATVFQLVSTIRGALAPGRGAIDLIRACFPGGSMTGAPKKEAMRIIDQLERRDRGVYSGAIGYWDYSGAMDLCIVIRTIIQHREQLRVSVGGAILADSIPEAEWTETQDKAQALYQALEGLLASSRAAVGSEGE